MGAEAVARGEPDGYTLGLTLDTVLTANESLYKVTRFNAATDFTLLAAVAESGQMLVVHPSLGVGSVDDLIQYARTAGARNEPIIYGSGGGTGTPGHLAMESFRQYAAFPATHLPFRGNPAMVMALVTGEIKLAFVSSASVIEYVHGGKLRALGVSHSERAILAPNIPTIAELGHTGFSVGFSHVLIAPSG